MTDIILAECGGSAWLVRGEQHIDDLLGNTLQGDITIEIVPCQSKSAVDALWAEWNGTDAALAWAIHPAILRRVRGQGGSATVVFQPWSAALDKAAEQVLKQVASAGPVLVLVRHLPADAAGAVSALADLRCVLMEGALIAAGATCVERETRVGDGVDQVMIEVRAG